MARKISVELVDDLNGNPAAETVQFSLGRDQLEIDLSADNAQRLRAIFEPYVEHARLVSGRRRRPAAGQPRTRRSVRSAGARQGSAHPLAYSAEVRNWARGQGLEVAARGRIADAVIEKYQQRSRGRARRGR